MAELNLNISPDFTIEDIHKIREYNYEKTKNMTVEERRNYYKAGAEKAKKRMAELKAQKSKETKLYPHYTAPRNEGLLYCPLDYAICVFDLCHPLTCIREASECVLNAINSVSIPNTQNAKHRLKRLQTPLRV